MGSAHKRYADSCCHILSALLLLVCFQHPLQPWFVPSRSSPLHTYSYRPALFACITVPFLNASSFLKTFSMLCKSELRDFLLNVLCLCPDVEVAKSLLRSHKGWVTDVAWSPASAHLLASTSHDQTVKLWDIRYAWLPCIFLSLKSRGYMPEWLYRRCRKARSPSFSLCMLRFSWYVQPSLYLGRL